MLDSIYQMTNTLKSLIEEVNQISYKHLETNWKTRISTFKGQTHNFKHISYACAGKRHFTSKL